MTNDSQPPTETGDVIDCAPPTDLATREDTGTTPADPPQPPAPGGQSVPGREGDASRGEVALYAFGNVEGAIADHVPSVLQNILVVAMHLNPLLIGLILSIKSLWDSVTDPIMAHITDNTRTRWGRRRPYILFGGVLRTLLLVAFFAFMPTGGHITDNSVMEAQKHVSDAISQAEGAHAEALKTHAGMAAADAASRGSLLEGLDATQEKAHTAGETLAEQLPVLQADAATRAATVQQRQAELDALDPSSASEGALADARGNLATAQEKHATAQKLVDRAVEAQGLAIAAEHVARHVRDAAQDVPAEGALATIAQAQAAAEQTYAGAGLLPRDIFAPQVKPTPEPSAKKGMWENLAGGFNAYLDPANASQRGLVIYLLIGLLLFTTFTTINAVPYFALGIELSPSYEGRTQVVTYRAIMNKVAGLAQPWVAPFCFALWFTSAIDGMFWVAVFAAVIGVPSTVLMVWYTRERTHATVAKPGKRPNMFRSVWEIAKCPEFLRVAGLFVFVAAVNGIFTQIGFFLNVYWVMGSALSGATLGAWVAMLAWALGFASLPVINWACNRFQKHVVLRFAVIWMMIGSALKWWAMNPEHPEYQFVLPFFFSIGIASIFTVLMTMLADVTDVDELRHGVRREGMFGAVNALLMKLSWTLIPVIAGAVLVMSGFDPALEYQQTPETIFRMRLLYSFVPAIMLSGALLLLWRYPLTRERVAEIKAQLKARHDAEDAAA